MVGGVTGYNKGTVALSGDKSTETLMANVREVSELLANAKDLSATYVFDRNGNAVGEPLLGGIDNADNLAQLQKNIDTALAADQK